MREETTESNIVTVTETEKKTWVTPAATIEQVSEVTRAAGPTAATDGVINCSS